MFILNPLRLSRLKYVVDLDRLTLQCTLLAISFRDDENRDYGPSLSAQLADRDIDVHEI